MAVNYDLLIKLAKLANENPNDNEANAAARKVCQLIKAANYQFPAVQKPTPASNLTWNDVQRARESWWKSTPQSPPQNPYAQNPYEQSSYYPPPNPQWHNFDPLKDMYERMQKEKEKEDNRRKEEEFKRQHKPDWRRCQNCQKMYDWALIGNRCSNCGFRNL